MGSRLEHHMRYFEQHQFLDASVLKQHQMTRLAELLSSAFQWVPEYQKRMLEAKVAHQGRIILSNFQELQTLTRTDLALRSERFLHRKAKERGVFYNQTGGSSGTPIRIAQDNAYRDWCLASNLFFNTWAGLTIGTPYFFLWGAYRDIQKQKDCFKEKIVFGLIQDRRVLNCRVTSPELLKTFIENINAQKDCVHMVGYAYELYALACYSLEHHLPLNRRFKVVFATAEQLTPTMKEAIESVFGCTVINRYGCRDVGDIAAECEHQNGLHINPLYTYVEAVDDEGGAVPYGEEGQILVTNLYNETMPMIRYELGDKVILQPPFACACGRRWETISRITGRTNEKLRLPDGSWLGGAFFHNAFEHLPHLKRYQVLQIAPDRLVIRLRSSVPDYVVTYEDALAELCQKVRAWTGFPFHVEFQQCEAFERTANGKELVFIQKMVEPVRMPGAPLMNSHPV